MTDDALIHLTEMPKLHVLDLHLTPVSDECLKHLTKLKSLRSLNIRDTKISNTGFTQLKAALPDCDIQSDFDQN